MTSELRRWDRDHVWHPFTPHSLYAEDAPLMVVSGEGNELIDEDGRRYLDGVASLWCNVFGHRHPKINAAIATQLDRIAHATFLGNAAEPAVRLAKRLVELAPDGLSRVFYSDSGATAVEIALKIAYQYWQQQDGGSRRQRFLCLDNAYHGDTLGAVSVGGMDLFHGVYGPLLFGTDRGPSPDCYRCPYGLEKRSCQRECVDGVVEAVRRHGDELAAVIVEPGFQGAAGILPLPEELLPRLRAACDEVGTLLIADEVAAGFGRCGGALFACEDAGVTPDLLCLGKGLTGGYLPMAATLTTERLFEGFLGGAEKTFFHGHTYTGNGLGSAAALATLDLFEEDAVLAGLPAKVQALSKGLEPLGQHPHVGEIRQVGLAVGIELVADRKTRTPFPADQRTGMAVCTAARDQGVFLRPLGDVVVLMPPLSITVPEIGRLVEAVGYGLSKVLGP